jgi:tape measure domain-containing protein
MGAAAELFVKVTADVKGLTAGFDGAEQAAKKLGAGVDTAAGHWVDAAGRMRDASGKFVAGAGQAGAAADTVAGKFSQMGAAIQVAGLVAVGAAMGAVAKQAVTLAGELEQNRVAFTTMLGSADKADAMLRELATFAAQTPFELRGLTASSKRLLAFGFSAESVIPIMNSVGNAVAAAGGGKDVINGVTLALGQMAAKGKVSAEEMNQLAERGIPAWKMLADGIGVSIPEAMKKAERGSIDAGTAITALVNGMNTKFPGMMAKQSQTIMGALSNLQDSADVALTKIGQKLIETFNLTRLVQQMSAAISNLTAAFTTGGLLGVLDKAFGPTTKAAIVGIAAALAGPMITSLAGVAASFAAATAAAAPFLALGAAVAFAAYPIIKNWDGIRGTITALWDTAAQYTSAYYNRAVRVVNDLVKMFTTGFNFIGSSIRAVLGDELTNKLLGGVSKAAGAFKGFAEVATTPLRAVGSVASAAASNFADTWRDAMSVSKGFTSDLFRQAGAVTRDFSKTLTADMLGLAKASATAANGAKKAAAGIKAKGDAAKKAAAEVRALEAATAKLFKVYQRQEAATAELGKRLAEVDRQAAAQGLAFDAAGARAKAYKDSISGIVQAFGQFSPQARLAQQEMERLKATSEGGGAALAKAYQTLNGVAAGLEQAQLKANLLGQEFDAGEAALKEYDTAVRELIALGLKPGNAALDEAIKRYDEASEAKQRAAVAATSYTDAAGGVLSAVSRLFSGTKDLIEAFGLRLPEGLERTIGGTIKAANAMIETAAAAAKLGDSVSSIATIASKDPTGGFATVVIGSLVLGYNALTSAIDANRKRVEEKNRVMAEAREKALDLADAHASVSANLLSSDLAARQYQQTMIETARINQESFAAIKTAAEGGLKASVLAFMTGAENYGEILREKVREGILNAVIDAIVSKAMINQFDGLIQQIVTSFESGTTEGIGALTDQLVDRLINMGGKIGELAGKLREAIGVSEGQLAQMVGGIQRQASNLREQHAATLNNIYRSLERGGGNSAVLLAQARVLQGRASEADIRLSRGMASGGLVTGPTIARMGEGGRNEAVLPLNENVYRQIGQGIAAARGGGAGTTLVVNYTGSGKWTREDAQGLGRLLVSELRAMGVRA